MDLRMEKNLFGRKRDRSQNKSWGTKYAEKNWWFQATRVIPPYTIVMRSQNIIWSVHDIPAFFIIINSFSFAHHFSRTCARFIWINKHTSESKKKVRAIDTTTINLLKLNVCIYIPIWYRSVRFCTYTLAIDLLWWSSKTLKYHEWW